MTLTYVPVSLSATPASDGWVLEWEPWWSDTSVSLPDAVTDVRALSGPDEATFIGVLAGGDDTRVLINVLNADGKSPPYWGRESYLAVADGMGAVWEPRRGTAAALIQEADE